MERLVLTERLNGYEFRLVYKYLYDDVVDEYLCYIFKYGKPLLNSYGEPICKKFERFHEIYFENFIKKFSSNTEYRNTYIEVA